MNTLVKEYGNQAHGTTQSIQQNENVEFRMTVKIESEQWHAIQQYKL